MLRLHYHAERREWLFQTLYESPAGVVDVSARTPPPLPQTVDAVLEAWVGLPWVDLEGETPASFLLHHRHEMFILASHLDEAVPKLLEHRNASAAFALSLLRADVAEPWLRELVMDSTQYGWESGCSYPTSSIGIVALEQLHGLPVHELMKIKPSDRRDMNRAIEAADQLEGMDRWCGEGGFARHILAAFEPAE